ncbi:MAG: S8 family serine peptidase [Candidatus Muirbacterium halophilum]|nr:S8 family serine peptidase [Candidatus Muirbacterium halophilum]MCK9474407.1 S8 family serine peptidase [Candidatus Muirbacterium halophilum]
MKKFIIVSSLAAILCSTVFSADFGYGMKEFLNRGNSEKTRVFVTFKEPAFLSSDNYLKDLKEKALISQKDFLEKYSQRNNVNSFWSANAVVIDADKELIEEISLRKDVDKIFVNPEMKFFDEISYKAVDNSNGSVYALKSMNVIRAWEDFGIKGQNTISGVVDSGLNKNLDVFKGKLIQAKNFAGDINDVTDKSGHGTHVSGTVVGGEVSDDLYDLIWGMYWQKAGTFKGNIGVAPEAKLLFSKCSQDNGNITFEDILEGLEWMADPDNDANTKDGARVINASLGADVSIPELRQPLINIQKTGVFLCFAAGNSGKICGSPADFPEIFAVGAVDASDRKASFSSIGPVNFDGKDHIKPDVCAPGVKVVSYYGDKLAGVDGTSMASPNTAGVITLIYSADPSLTVDEVKDILKKSALDLGEKGADNLYGHGRVDAYKALSLVTGKNEFKADVYQFDSMRNAILENLKYADGSESFEKMYNNASASLNLLVDSIVEKAHKNRENLAILNEIAADGVDLFIIFEKLD